MDQYAEYLKGYPQFVPVPVPRGTCGFSECSMCCGYSGHALKALHVHPKYGTAVGLLDDDTIATGIYFEYSNGNFCFS